jgi:hypothetical protein
VLLQRFIHKLIGERMSGYALRLVTDRLAPRASLALAGDAIRILYVAEGSLGIAAAGTVASLDPNSAWHGVVAAELKAGAAGARVLRFELAAGDGAAPTEAGEGVESRLALAMPVTLERTQAYLMRCDRVGFPPGGVAYTHTHQGPGIRCLQLGSIRIDSAGASHHYAPGEAWFESGPEPVFAAGSDTVATAFIRTMILPRAYLGRSSIRYMKAEDQDKPKPQSYQVYIDAAIELPGSRT